MDIITYSKLKKCISIDINAGHSFATNTDRDTFFTANPTQLKANMYIYCNGQLQQYINSAWEVKSTAIQGSKGDKGDSGTNGTNGITPHIDETTKHWFIGTTDTGILAEGNDGTNGNNGISPHIGLNGNWYIGETDTLVKAQGTNGNNGTDGTDGIGIQSVVDNNDNTFTITLSDDTTVIIDKIDTINSDVITQGTTKLLMTTAERTKLTSVENGAEVNNISDTNVTDLTDNGDTTLHYHSSDRDRTNHTGVQAISTITGLQTALDSKTNKDFTTYTQKADVANDDKIAINDSVDNNSIKYVTLNQLISSVQDPHNKGYYTTGTALNTAIPTATNGDFAVVGATNTIWVWNGTTFVDSSANGAVLSLNGRTGVITLTKADVGLNNVVNLDTSTTVNITDSTDKRFVTDANLVVIGNTSGTNTGDETNATIKTKLGTDLTNKVDKVTGKSLISDTEITRLATVVNYDDTSVESHMSNTDIHVTTTNKSNWDAKANGTHTHVKTDITDFPAIPTKTSDLTNDSGFLTSIPSEYINETELSTALTPKLEATNIIAGTNVTLTKDGNNITINATGEISGDVSADVVTYDNTISGLTAINVKTAIDELENEIDNLQTKLIPSTSTTATLLAPESFNAYTMAITANTTFVLPTISDNTKHYEILINASFSSASLTIAWGTTYFFNGTAPTIEAGNFNIIYEWDNLLQQWVCGLVKKAVVS